MNQASQNELGSQGLRIDVDEVFRKKGKTLYPFIPRFIINYLKRIVHQDEINATLPRLIGKVGLEFIDAVLFGELGITVQVANPESIPAEGRYVVVSNHPLGGLDGMAIMHVLGKNRSDLQFISNDILLELKPLSELFAPVNKHGRNSKEVVAALDTLYASDQVVLIFPAGLVSRRQKGRIEDLEWKKSFITKSIQHKRDIIPVHIEGRNSDFFYNLASWRKRLRIKSNIEMLYLADEMYKQRNNTIRLRFGKPVSYRCFTREKSHVEWAQLMKQHVYNIPKGIDEFQMIHLLQHISE